MARLNATAKETLRAAGIPQAAWARANYMRDGKWSGDQCGCPDDRCANGFHHMGTDDCGCLPTLISQYFEWLRGGDSVMFDTEAYEYVNRVVIEDRRQPVPSLPDLTPDERETLAAILSGYAGLFVAVCGSEVIASGTDFEMLRDLLQAEGLTADLVMRVPDHKPQEG